MFSPFETESDYEDVDIKDEAIDIDGSRMRDGKGRRMVKVCEDEDQDDVHVKQEIEELQNLDSVGTGSRTTAVARRQTTPDRTGSRPRDRTASSPKQPSTTSYPDPPDRIRLEDIPQYVETHDPQTTKNPNGPRQRRRRMHPQSLRGNRATNLRPLDKRRHTDCPQPGLQIWPRAVESQQWKVYV